eukprot:TRINITY_DN8951_c0_g1_i1.p1 TRINITY_DN8951_c0_g1~~TRINITY_DN8951_c0_g1_i1.p1  ORF type:complete len:224 (-),score=-16.69 TRINITY_DN8951_c0_g1_i1:316-987(-)
MCIRDRQRLEQKPITCSTISSTCNGWSNDSWALSIRSPEYCKITCFIRGYNEGCKKYPSSNIFRREMGQKPIMIITKLDFQGKKNLYKSRKIKHGRKSLQAKQNGTDFIRSIKRDSWLFPFVIFIIFIQTTQMLTLCSQLSTHQEPLSISMAFILIIKSLEQSKYMSIWQDTTQRVERKDLFQLARLYFLFLCYFLLLLVRIQNLISYRSLASWLASLLPHMC